MSTRRAALTQRERERMFDAQNGMCFCACGQPLGKTYVAEHWQPVALGNDSKPDCLLRKACADLKTYGSPGRVGGDIRDIKHIRKLEEKRTQADRRAERGPKLRSNARLQSRGFDKTLSKKFDGTVEKRNGR